MRGHAGLVAQADIEHHHHLLLMATEIIRRIINKTRYNLDYIGYIPYLDALEKCKSRSNQLGESFFFFLEYIGQIIMYTEKG